MLILQKYKIVFGGKMGAGKTEAIQSLSETTVFSTEALNTDQDAHSKALTTVGIDYGEIKIEDDVVVGLYGTPGQERFDFLWPVICEGALGAIVLIDHSSRTAIDDLAYYVEIFSKFVSNMIIGITHVDEDPQQLLKKYRNWLQMRNIDSPIFAMDARKKDDVLLLVEVLIARAEVQYL